MSLPPRAQGNQQWGQGPTLEEVLLGMTNTRHRQVVADLRASNIELQRYVTELEGEVATHKNKIASLEAQLVEFKEKPVAVAAPIKSLEDLLSSLKQQYLQKLEGIRRSGAEDVRNADDSAFDATIVLHQAISKTMRPTPKSFEYVDLMSLRECILQEGFAPSSPLQLPLIQEFIGHVDAVRQCTRDGRIAHMQRDPVRQDTLRRLFDACKGVEVKLGAPSHLTLPPQSVVVDLSTASDVMTKRTAEMTAHVLAIEKCGEVFELACRDVQGLDEQYNNIVSLPTYISEYDALISGSQNEVENLLQNDAAVKEISVALLDTQRTQKDHFTELSDAAQAQLIEKQKSVDIVFEQIKLMLMQCEQSYDICHELMRTACFQQVEAAKCEYRSKQLSKAIDQELLLQNRFLEGTRFTTFLATKAKELYRKMYTNMEDSMRSRREMCERTKTSAQEQLYSMAENLHDIITKRLSQDNLAIRTDQQQLDTANRSLMGLVHVPQEMEKQMESIRRLTMSISSSKHRMNQCQADITTIKQLLAKYNTLQYLKRDMNFLSLFEGIEKQAKLKEKLDEVTQKVKFVSEVLVEIADPETRQDYVVQQALDALKQTVADFNDLMPSKTKIEDLEEQFRVNTSTRLKRHKRLMAHFIEEVREGTNDLNTKEPAIEVHALALMDNMQVILSALTHNEEPVPSHLRSAYLQSAGLGIGPQQSYYDTAAGTNPAAASQAHQPGGKFGGGIGRSLGADPHSAFDEMPTEQPNHTFARVSDRLKISQESHRITKIPGGIEMSNTSALGAIGFRLSSGIHFYAIRVGQNCSRLLVGFADWNLPLDGYCNSIKYHGCYYLHIGNGTLWAPDQKIERKQYTYESIGSQVGGVLQCVVNTNDRTISFVWNDQNLGVAFRNVNLTRTLYPAFEVFNNNCSVEFTTVVATQKPSSQS